MRAKVIVLVSIIFLFIFIQQASGLSQVSMSLASSGTIVSAQQSMSYLSADEASKLKIAKIYPEGMHGAIAKYLRMQDMQVRTATLDEPEHGLTDAVVNNTDVLIWWGHMAHNDVRDEIVEKVNLGTTMEDALNEAITLTPSPELRKLMWQVLNAMRTGADVAMESAGVTLVRGISGDCQDPQAKPRNNAQYSSEPLLCFYLQYVRRAPCCWHCLPLIRPSVESYDRKCRNDLELRVCYFK
jgi:hypothetical protein